MHKLWLIIKREYITRVKTKGFVIGIAVAGILWQHSDGGYSRLAARILIGGAIAVGAANIYLFLFPIGVAV